MERLLAYFERISEAPDAVGRLRRFVLDLAVRGELVEQVEMDLRPAPPVTRGPHDRSPLLTPQSWSWVRVGEVADCRLGKMLDKAKNRGTPRAYLRNVNVRWFDFDLSDVLEMPFEDSELEEFRLRSGDVLICEGGEPGRAAVWDEREHDIYFQKAIHRVRFSEIVSPHFFVKVLHLFAQSGLLAPYFTGVGIKHLTGRGLASVLLPLPPLAEQHRIVDKVDELMALCDRLEAAQAERETRRDRLTAASLARLSQAAEDPQRFRDDARFHLDHLPQLVTRVQHVALLRKAIRNLAVRGKLVPQVENEGEEGCSCGDRESQNEPFETPKSWCWVRVGEVASCRLGKMLDKVKNRGTPRRYLRNVNVRWFDFDLSDVLEMPFEDSELEEFSLRAGDVLVCEGGEPGRAAVWDERENEVYFQKAIHRVRFREAVAPEYFVNVVRFFAESGLLAPYFTGVGIKHFTGRGLDRFLFPLPSLAEQHRIVAKVDQLMALCDQLEAQLGAAQIESRRLLEAVLHEALAPAA
ncbi:MAG: restriction endonuclease subunit S [Deltaproteobacteria bacterium]|nr:restriction endonuclease subunit S [Deltaproteobacteria bacterium]